MFLELKYLREHTHYKYGGKRYQYHKCAHLFAHRKTYNESSNGGHSGVIFFKPEKNLDFFRLKNDPRDAAPGRLK